MTGEEIVIDCRIPEYTVVFHRKPLRSESTVRTSANDCVEAEMKLFYHADVRYRFIGYVHLD